MEEKDLNKKIELTELDYMNLCAWITHLENRIEELERTVGILEDVPKHSTLAKKRIYEEVSHKEGDV